MHPYSALMSSLINIVHWCIPLHPYCTLMSSITSILYIDVFHYIHIVHWCLPLHPYCTLMSSITSILYIDVFHYIHIEHWCLPLHPYCTLMSSITSILNIDVFHYIHIVHWCLPLLPYCTSMSSITSILYIDVLRIFISDIDVPLHIYSALMSPSIHIVHWCPVWVHIEHWCPPYIHIVHWYPPAYLFCIDVPIDPYCTLMSCMGPYWKLMSSIYPYCTLISPHTSLFYNDIPYRPILNYSIDTRLYSLRHLRWHLKVCIYRIPNRNNMHDSSSEVGINYLVPLNAWAWHPKKSHYKTTMEACLVKMVTADRLMCSSCQVKPVTTYLFSFLCYIC